MTTISIEVELGKTKEDGNTIFGEGLSEEQINKIINRVMNEPDFRRGELETIVYINQDLNMGSDDEDENTIEVSLGLFDVWGGENNEEDDVWGEYPTKTYQLTDF